MANKEKTLVPPRQKPKCPKCNSSQTLYRQRDQKHWCRVCGHEWPKRDSSRDYEACGT